MASPSRMGGATWASELLIAATTRPAWRRPTGAARARTGATPRARRLLFAALVAACAVGAGMAGGLAPRTAGHHARQDWAALPPAARGPISSAIGSTNRAFWVRRSGRRFVMNGAGLTASFSTRGARVQGDGMSWRFQFEGYGYGTRLDDTDRALLTATRNRLLISRPGLGVVESYANGPMGIEQGFQLLRPPPGKPSQPLALSLGRLPGGTTARIGPGGRSLELSRGGRIVVGYYDLSARDASGRALSASIELSHGTLLLRVDDRGARYPLSVDPLVRRAGGSVAAEGLGNSVAISGDGATVAVGAPDAKVDGHFDQGAVYVFRRGAGGWASEHEVARLTASDGAASDYLGSISREAAPDGVAISDNGATIVAGAPGAPGAGQGAAYVFHEPGGGWTSEHQAAELTPSHGSGSAQLGPVAISGDGRTIAVGSYDSGAGSGYGYGGGVFLFTRPPGGWRSEHQVADLTSSDNGIAISVPVVALSNDGTTVVVGARSAVVNGSEAEHYDYGQGAAYVFSRPADGWRGKRQQDVRLIDPRGQVGDGFGAAVAVTGNGSTVALTGAGRVYVFAKDAARWKRTAKLSVPSGRPPVTATAISISKKGTTIATGGPQLNGAPRSVYVLTQSKPGDWKGHVGRSSLTAVPHAAGDDLGESVAMSKGGATIVSGAAAASDGQGATFVFTRARHGWSSQHETATLTASLSLSTDNFGASVATSADGSTVVVGVPYAQLGPLQDTGAAFVFRRSASGWTSTKPIAELTAAQGKAGDGFGASVAISGDGRTIAVAAPVTKVGHHAGQGAAYVFKEPPGGWVSEHQVATLTASNGGAGDGLGGGFNDSYLIAGGGLAISGNGATIVVGSPDHFHGNGALYVFSRPASGWRSEHETARPSTPWTGLGFPVAISGDGDTIAAGENGGEDGKVAVFSKPPSGWAPDHQSVTLFVARFAEASSVAISSGGSTLAVGSRGKVHVFTRPSGGWTRERPAAVLAGPPGTAIGGSIAMSADGSSIATADSVPYDIPNGAVVVFTESPRGWSDKAEGATLTTSDRTPSDGFGNALAFSADGNTLAVTAPGAGAYSQGAAYIFARPPTGWSNGTQTAKLTR